MNPGISIVMTMQTPHQQTHAEALRSGLVSCGVKPIMTTRHGRISTRHAACWGWRYGAGLRAAGHEVLIMERAYLGDRFAWTSLGWNGLNGHAEFAAPKDDGGARLRQHFAKAVKAWRTGGEYTLIIGQVPGDSALRGKDMTPWYAGMAQQLKQYGLPVKFRPHPLGARRGGPSNVPGAETLPGDLDAALSDAALVVTWNSNTGVDALVAGRPTVALDPGSMAYGVALGHLPESLDVPEPDRPAWLHQLAWKQWTMEEISNGTAWQHVGRAVNG